MGVLGILEIWVKYEQDTAGISKKLMVHGTLKSDTTEYRVGK